LENPWIARKDADPANPRSKIPFVISGPLKASAKHFQIFLWPFRAISMNWSEKKLKMRFLIRSAAATYALRVSTRIISEIDPWKKKLFDLP